MPRSTLLLLIIFCSLVSPGQNISVTFSGTVAVNQIDSVTATNLATNQCVTLPGNETLLLTGHTGIQSISGLVNPGMVFPNPCSGKATFISTIQNPQTVYLKIRNLTGQIVAETKAYVQPVENKFAISLGQAGIYVVTLTTDQGASSYKVICTEATHSENSIQYLGSSPSNHNDHNDHNNLSPSGLKSSHTSYTLGYTVGDIILYRCMSGICTTIVTDSPDSSKNYPVEFAACTDPDGKNYSIVKIGYQTWMAENLAWLPFVSEPIVYGTSPYLFVYGYMGTSVRDAKAAASYSAYGVLYNFEAAQIVCPAGWHLPTPTEWTVLTDHLGGWENAGGKLRETGSKHWQYPNEGATNSSGFTALAGGSRVFQDYIWHLEGLGSNAFFWSSLSNGSTGGWILPLQNTNYVLFQSSFYQVFCASVRCVKNGPSPVPKARFTVSPHGGIASTIFQFDASGSTDIETAAEDLEVRWKWNGDTIWDTGYAKIKTMSHQFTTSGSYLVNLEVKDADSLVGSKFTIVIVGGSIFTDSRDGHEYSSISIGAQTWMAENLAWLPSVRPSSSLSIIDPYYYVNDYEGSSVSEAMATDNYDTYGVLYNWQAASTACPPGWHLPSDEEWTVLSKYLGTGAGKKMKFTGLWSENGNGDNSSGFTALPSDSRGGGVSELVTSASFWSASGYDESYAWNRRLNYSSDGLSRDGYVNKLTGMSVRCVKGGHDPAAPTARFTMSPVSGTTSTIFQFDASGSTDYLTVTEDLEVRWDWEGDGAWDNAFDKTKTALHQYHSNGAYRVILEVKDGEGLTDTLSKRVTVGVDIFIDSRDGNEYLCTKIGTQTWMIENLAWLPVVSASSADSDTEKLYHVYKYNGTSISEAKESDNYKTYGVLYNWPAAMNGEFSSTEIPSGIQGVCPSGWHLPSDPEWTVLTDYLGSAAGKKMKADFGWSSGNGDNSSAYTALPGGYRNLNGIFSYLGKNAWFWSTSADGSTNALCRYLDGYFDGVVRDTKSRGYGYSVRCIRD